MGCKKAVPDIDRVADGLLDALSELQQLALPEGPPPTSEEQEHVAPV
jgi:hypothetical protein